MNIKEIVEAIKKAGMENGETLVTGVEDLYHNLNNENKKLRVARETAVEKIKELSGVDDDDLDILTNALKKKDSGSKALEAQLKKLSGKVDILEKEKEELKLGNLKKDRDASIRATLAKKGVRASAVTGLAKMFGATSKLDVDGEWMLEDKPLDDGIETYLKENSYVIDAKQVKGTGTKEPGKTTKSTKSYLSSSDVREMSSAERTKNMAIIRASRAKAAEENKEW